MSSNLKSCKWKYCDDGIFSCCKPKNNNNTLNTERRKEEMQK